MTDKQTIINGVDVSGCGFLLEREGKQKCECCHATGFSVICDCDKWLNCYYKQLKRKEQECKLLKASLKDINIVALVEENEKLKQKVQDDETSYLQLYENNSRECLELKNKMYALKKSLGKIEQIVNQDIAFMGYSDEFNDLILNEIKEALNEN